VRILTVGADALLLEFAAFDAIDAWRADLWTRREQGEFAAAEIVTGARTILLDGCADLVGLRALVSSWAPPAAASLDRAELVEIPIAYDGDDLDWVAAHLGRTVPELVDWHLGIEFQVAFCGFAPGFAYMTGSGVTVPRLDTPRARVPAGAVGLADAYCGAYPASSPGGWRLIGRTSAVLFDPGREAPALLTPGTPVRFVRVGS
jgi:KipI family sensor histidine kinase inhibitor